MKKKLQNIVFSAKLTKATGEIVNEITSTCDGDYLNHLERTFCFLLHIVPVNYKRFTNESIDFEAFRKGMQSLKDFKVVSENFTLEFGLKVNNVEIPESVKALFTKTESQIEKMYNEPSAS